MHHSKLQNKLLCSLNSQRIERKFCDVILILGKNHLTMHSCVLAAHCPTIFSNCNVDSCSFENPLKIVFDEEKGSKDSSLDCSDCVFKVIEFMYIGHIQYPKEHSKHIEAVGRMFGLSDLLSICEDIVNNCDDFLVPLQDSQFTYSDYEFVESLDYDNDAWTNADLQKDQCKSDNVVLTKINMFSKRPLPEKTKTCFKCNLQFSNSVDLRRHRETHLGKLYTCYTCKYSSQKAFQLIKHLLESKHNESVCSLCMLEADNPDKLRKHLESHNHKKPFYCTICNLRFPTRAGLNIHTPKHSSEKPFFCSTCNRGFKWKHNLQSHMVVHSAEKKHLCDQCGYSTAHKSSFSAHELTHTGVTFKCPQPGCKFISVIKRNIRSHVATHRKEKPYQCEICGQSFSQAKNLRRHAIKHDATVDLDCCPLCNFKTMRYDKLKEHFKKHHEKESDVKLLPKKKKTNTPPMFSLQSSTSDPLENLPVGITTICIPDEFIITSDSITTIKNEEWVTVQVPMDLTSNEVLEPETQT